MVCRLDDMHPLDALYRSCRAYPGGIEALAHRLGRSAAVLYQKLRHQVDKNHVNYDGELSEILFCLEEAKVPGWEQTLHALCWRHRHLAVPMPEVITQTSDELTSMILTTVKEQGEVAAAIGRALESDRRIDSREFHEIDRDIEEAMTALAALRERVRDMHEEAKAKGLVR